MKDRIQKFLILRRNHLPGEGKEQYIKVYLNEFLSVVSDSCAVFPYDGEQRATVYRIDGMSKLDFVENFVVSGSLESPGSRDEKILLKRKMDAVLKVLQLEGTRRKRIRHLTEFQRYRVALAKALMTDPEIIICNNPFSATESKLRTEMLYKLRDVQKKLGITIVYVTQEDWEALRVSDRMMVMQGEQIAQTGTPEEIYHHPETFYVASTIEDNNILEGYVQQDKDGKRMITESGIIYGGLENFKENELLYAAVRPEHIRMTKDEPRNIKIKGVIADFCFAGAHYEVKIRLGNNQIVTVYATEKQFAVGEVVYLDWEKGRMTMIHTEGEPIYQTIESLSKKIGNSLTISV